MRNDLDKLMQDYHLDAIVAFGSVSDPAFNYLTAGSDISDAMFTKTLGRADADGAAVAKLMLLTKHSQHLRERHHV